MAWLKTPIPLGTMVRLMNIRFIIWSNVAKAGDQGCPLAKPAGVGYLLTGESVLFFAVFDIL